MSRTCSVALVTRKIGICRALKPNLCKSLIVMQMRVVQVLGLGLGLAEEPQEVTAATGDRSQKKV